MFALVTADSTGPFDLIGDLPVHPLVVHAAVVLVPLAALGVLLMALVPRISRTLGWLVVIAGAAATVACFVARLAGEALAERIGDPGFSHRTLGTWMPFFALALTLVALALWLVDRRRIEEAPAPRGGLGSFIAVLGAALALANGFWVFRVGDSGARSVWTGRVVVSELPSAEPTPALTPTPSPTAAEASPTTGATPATHSMASVAAHNTVTDCWVAAGGGVYDLTAWIAGNPIGSEAVTSLCGTDASSAFTGATPPIAADQLATLRIGTVG